MAVRDRLNRPESPPPATVRRLQFTLAMGGALGLAYVGWKAAEASRSPVAVFLCFACLAAVLLDLAVAIVVTSRARIALTAHPTDITVGERVCLHISVTGTRLPLKLRLFDWPVRTVSPPLEAKMGMRPATRGVIGGAEVEIVSRGLCGLGGFLRKFELSLPRVVEVGPRPIEGHQPLVSGSHTAGEGAPLPSSWGDLVRGVRAYVPGDRTRQVHWRMTARVGTLVVKEIDDDPAPVVVLVLQLASTSEADEQAAGRASWYGREALNLGWSVVLATMEAGGAVTSPVQSVSALNQRLAHAVVGLPDAEAAATHSERVLLLTAEGDSWL